jgi:hypothetical protein
LNPDSADEFYNRGRTYARKGDDNRAIQTLIQALQLVALRYHAEGILLAERMFGVRTSVPEARAAAFGGRVVSFAKMLNGCGLAAFRSVDKFVAAKAPIFHTFQSLSRGGLQEIHQESLRSNKMP